MTHTVALAVAAGYGVLSLVGGVIGFAKAKSRASLIAGGASGLLLIGGALVGLSQPMVGLGIAAVVSLLLVIRFAKSAVAKGPSPIASVMIAGGLAVLISAGLALA